MTTIDRLRHPSISEAVTRAAGIDPEPTPSRGVTRWTAPARRAVSPAARPTSWKSARGPGQRGRGPRSGRGVRCTRHPMPASKPSCVATARSWPTAPAGDGRTQCDSMVCSTRPGRVPPVGSGPLAARPGREGYPGRFWLKGEALPLFFAGNLNKLVYLCYTSTIKPTFFRPAPPSFAV